MPWLARFALPSLLSIAVTYLVLRWTQRALAKEEIAAEVARPELPWTGSFHIWNPRESPNGGFVLVREVQN